MHVTNGHLVAQVDAGVDAEEIRHLAAAALDALRVRPVRGLVVDVSAVQILGSQGFESLRRLVSAAHVAGIPAVVVGFQPGVAAALVDLDVDPSGLPAARTVEDGIAWLERARRDEGGGGG